MNSKVVTFDKKNIFIDENGFMKFECSKDFARDIKKQFGIDVQKQSVLRHVYFGTCSGKISFTVPNKLLNK